MTWMKEGTVKLPNWLVLVLAMGGGGAAVVSYLFPEAKGEGSGGADAVQNQRLDTVERRLERMDDKLDRILDKLSRDR